MRTISQLDDLDNARRRVTGSLTEHFISDTFNNLGGFFMLTAFVPTHWHMGERFVSLRRTVRAAFIGFVFLFILTIVTQELSPLVWPVYLGVVIGAFVQRGYTRRQKKLGNRQHPDFYGIPQLYRFMPLTRARVVTGLILWGLVIAFVSASATTFAWWFGLSAFCYSFALVRGLLSQRDEELEQEAQIMTATLDREDQEMQTTRDFSRRRMREDRGMAQQLQTEAMPHNVTHAAAPAARQPARQRDYGDLLDGEDETR